MYYCKSGEVLQFGFSSNPHSQRFVFAYQLRISIKENKMTITKFQCAISHLVRNNLKTPAGFHHLHLGPVCTQRQRGWNAWKKKEKRKQHKLHFLKAWILKTDLIWTEPNYSDFTRVELQTEVAAFLKPWQISIYMSLLHQQFCFFFWDAELCWKKPHSKTSAYRKLQFTCSQGSLFTKDWYKIKQ